MPTCSAGQLLQDLRSSPLILQEESKPAASMNPEQLAIDDSDALADLSAVLEI